MPIKLADVVWRLCALRPRNKVKQVRSNRFARLNSVQSVVLTRDVDGFERGIDAEGAARWQPGDIAVDDAKGDLIPLHSYDLAPKEPAFQQFGNACSADEVD